MMARSEEVLPVDVFHLLSVELSNRLDFPTLYNVAVSSKHLADSGAIAALYRICHLSPVKGGGTEGHSFAEQGLSLAERGLVVQRWSILWRTIVLSTFGKTLYPYSRYLRSLDLIDLGNLLDDDQFRGKITKNFFADELAQFNFQYRPEYAAKRGALRLDVKRTITAIGNEITENASLLESISEPTNSDVLSGALPLWTPRLSNLRSLVLWDGKIFGDETARNLLHSHCPHLSALTIYQLSLGDESDHNLAAFISGMPDNSLTHFENIRNCGIGAETCIALNNHGGSLHTLKLALMEEGVLALALLQGCTSIERLTLEALIGSPDLKATQHDVYIEIMKWLENCRAIQELSFNNFISAPSLCLPVLLNKDNLLQSLDITGKDPNLYLLRAHHDFHQALGAQTNLQQLGLHADPDAMVRDDVEILINSLCSLKSLHTLKLTRVSENFVDEHIALLAYNLSELEELLIGGYGISDAIWPSVANLQALKMATFNGLTNFTFDGIKDFISQLGEGNTGLNLSVDMADPDFAMLPEDQAQLRELIAEKIDGRFDYQLLRGIPASIFCEVFEMYSVDLCLDPDMPEFDSEDSD